MIHVAPKALGSDKTNYSIIKMSKARTNDVDKFYHAFLSQCLPYDSDIIGELLVATELKNYILFVEGFILTKIFSEGNFFG